MNSPKSGGPSSPPLPKPFFFAGPVYILYLCQNNMNNIVIYLFPDINPCFGDLPVVDENTGLEYNCGIYGAECPPSSFCHQTAHFAKCCPIGMAFIFCMFFLLMQYSMMMSDVFFLCFLHTMG